VTPLWTSVLFALIEIIPKLIELVNNTVAALEKSGEWTPTQAAAFRARMETAFGKPHWQPKDGE